MFGYVTAYKPEMKMKDFYKYKAYYCGLCHVLKQRHGIRGQITLTYDMTFLVTLLTSLYEPETVHEKNRCMVHPVKEHDMLFNEITEYAADMNIVLMYYHFLDDWKDEKSMTALAGLHTYRKLYKKVEEKYPKKCREIRRCLAKLQSYEKAGEENIDAVSGCFGRLMGELFLFRRDVWSENLWKMGFYLGKFIYILDAYDDLEKDRAQGSYNPLLKMAEEEGYDDRCRQMLTMILAECSSYFEMLPCVENIDILRNILYVGVWNKFDEKSAVKGTAEKSRLEEEIKEKTEENYDSRSI